MGKGKRLKQFIVYLLAFCMMISCFGMTNMGTVQAAEADGKTTVYFYNSAGWSEIRAHIYNMSSQAADTTWPGIAVESAVSEYGENWWKVEVPSDPTFTIIFNNNNQGSQTPDTTISDENNVFMNANGGGAKVYATAEEAKAAATPSTGDGEGGIDAESTTLYFYNSDNWDGVMVYGYDLDGKYKDIDLFGGWPGTTVNKSDIGGDWYEITVNAQPPFSVKFYETGNDSTNTELKLPDADHVYVTILGTSFDSQEAAEEAVEAIKNPTGSTTVYFYNNHDWANVSAYAYYGASETQIFGGWPGEEAEEATDMGEGWWKKVVPLDAETTPFSIIFNNNNNGKQTANLYVDDNVNIYTNANGTQPYESKEAAVADATEPEEDYTTIQNGELTLYFYNNENWDNVYAYSYNGNSYVPGGESWPGALAESATDMGDNWWKVTVKADSLFSIIFHDNAGNRVEGKVNSTKDIYYSATGMVYQSPKELEISLGVGATPDNSTTVYFKKNSDWGNIYGYVYINDATYGASWPGVSAVDASEELGSKDWWKIIVPKVATTEDSFNVIFTDSMAQTDGILIDDQENVYIIPDSQVFDNVADADAEAAKYTPLFDREDPNEDLENYGVTLDGVGANLPYTTYEAEAAATNATVLEKNTEYLTMQSEASGRQAVKLENEGDYVEFTLTEDANAFVLRYSMPDSTDGTGVNASLSMYANGEESDLELTSKYAWIYGDYPYVNDPTAVSTGSNKVESHRFFDETRGLFGKTLPAGTKIKLQKNAEDTAAYYVIDFVECEMVDKAGTQPENSLSITDAEFGAVADDGLDDAAAIKACIAAAKEAEKEVWIPVGTFNVTEKTAFVVDGVTIRGAGMWYSELEGAGASFHYKGISKFYDFAMTGVSDIRKDAEDLAGFEGKGAALNVTIQNIWMEHMKVGVWSYNTKHLVIQGCRIRNTYADAINLSSRTVDSVVRNNSIRNTGDDGIACWPNTYNSTGNTIEYNTVQIPTLANGIIIYGGGDNKVEYNYVADTVVNGSGIGVGSEFTTSDGFTGPITIANNELHRCGSYHKDRAYPVGAIWVWASNGPMTTKYDITNNNLYDCSQEAFLLDCWSNLSGVTLKDNNVYGATDGILVRGNEDNSTVTGSATVDNVAVKDYTGKLVVNENPEFFTIVTSGKGIYDAVTGEAYDPNTQPEKPTTVAVTGVTLASTAVELEVGGTSKLAATVAPDNATDKTVTWTSSDEAVATVATDGTVTAVAPGKATITAKAGDKTATCVVTVKEVVKEPEETIISVDNVKISTVSNKLAAGAKVTMKATVKPSNADVESIKWSIREKDKKYASINAKTGKLKLKKAGAGKSIKVYATVTGKDGKTVKSKGYKIAIKKHKVKKVTIEGKSTISVKYSKKKVQLKTTVKTSGKSVNKKLKWTSSNTEYATVNSKGKVTFKAAGKGKKVTITATATDGTGKKDKVTIKIKK